MKRGEFSLSFSIILSVIIIAAVIAVGFYMVRYFLNLQTCTQQGLYMRDLQTKIDDAWGSDSTRDSYTGAVPSAVTKVCFGLVSDGRSAPEYQELRQFSDSTSNFFFYPIKQGCEITHGTLEHAEFKGFRCVTVEKQKATVALQKGSFDALVRVCDPRDMSCLNRTP